MGFTHLQHKIICSLEIIHSSETIASAASSSDVCSFMRGSHEDTHH